MRNYFLSLIFISVLSGLGAFAEGIDKASSKDSDSRFQERKAMTLKNIDERIESLNKMKTCINSATKKEEMRACRRNHHEAMENKMKETP